MSILGDIVGVVEDAGKWTYNTITHGANQLIPGSGPFKQVSWKGGGGSAAGSDYLNAAAAGQLGGGAPAGHHAPAGGHHAGGAGGGGGGTGTSPLDILMLTLVSNLLKNDPYPEPEPAPAGEGLSGTILTRTYGGSGRRRRTYLVPQGEEA